jgi:hypothetical protein
LLVFTSLSEEIRIALLRANHRRHVCHELNARIFTRYRLTSQNPRIRLQDNAVSRPPLCEPMPYPAAPVQLLTRPDVFVLMLYSVACSQSKANPMYLSFEVDAVMSVL